MKERGIYEDHEAVLQIVEIGRNMITACEENKMYPDDDFMWNRAVVAGNKLTTLGTTWGLQTIKDLSKDENKAVQHYLKYKKKFL
jgi:hypothetical protein|tara:strand:- start:141 stop:395 length:255 start_codon:yes stop_codon:yes gene_type:complete